MTTPDQPQIYLISPPQFELSRFNTDLGALLDGFGIACVRLRLASDNPGDIGRAADLLRETCHARDVPIVVENHAKLVETHGLDGVHLTDGARQIRDVRAALHDDAIIGSYCENSRHSGMAAGEAGADYIAFGPLSETPLSTHDPVDFDTFEWWSEVVEVPVVAEGAVTLDMAAKFAPVTDFFALGSELWDSTETPAKTLAAYIERIS